MKKGIGHIDVILAFVIFVGAIGFALFFFNPGDNSRVVGVNLQYSFREVMGNTSVEIETFSVILEVGAISADSVGILEIDFDGVEGNTRVETLSGQELGSGHSGSLVSVDLSGLGSEEVIFVIFSEDFASGSVNGGTAGEIYYEIASSNVKEVISERRFKALRDAYEDDYRGLKSQSNFNIPDRVNFGFTLTFDSADFIQAEREIPASLEVFSDVRRVEVLRETGEKAFADLTVKLW